MAPVKRRPALKNKTFRISASLEVRLEQRALAEGRSANQLAIELLERGLPVTSPFAQVRALGDRIARQRRDQDGPPPRFTKDELHGDE